MTPGSALGAGGNGPGRPPGVPELLIRVGDDFEDEYPGASALATECYANLCRIGAMLMELHNQQTRDQYQLSPSAREILAIIEGAGEALEPSVIAERLLITTGSMTSLLDALQRRGLIRRLPHPGDRRKLLVDITPRRPGDRRRVPAIVSRTRTRADLRSAHHQRAASPAPPPRQDPAGRHPGGPSPADTRRAPCPSLESGTSPGAYGGNSR